MSHIHLPKGPFAAKAKLFVAAAQGDLKTLEQQLATLNLVGSSNAINEYDDFGNTVLHMAAGGGHLRVMNYLIHEKAQVDIVTDPHTPGTEQRTPLHCAAIGGHANACKLLLSRMADPHAQDINGKKPVHVAFAQSAREVLQTSMTTSNNLFLANDILLKAEAATLMSHESLDLFADSHHLKKLKSSYEHWERDVRHRQKEGVGIPVHKMPPPKFIRECNGNPHHGTFLVLKHAKDRGGKEPFSGMCKALAVRYTGELALQIHDLWIRPDRRTQRMGTILILALLSLHAREQFRHAVVCVHRGNTAGVNFFMRLGFKRIGLDGVPEEFRKVKHDFLEMRNIGLGIMKVEHMLKEFQDVKVIADDDMMEEEMERVQAAKERRREEAARKKADLQSEEGRARLRLEAQMKGQVDSGETRFWMLPRPLPDKSGKLLDLPPEFFSPESSKLHEPWLSPDSLKGKLRKKVTRRGSMKLGAVPPDEHGDPEDKTNMEETGEATFALHVATEVDRVPDYVLKQYEPEVARTRDQAVAMRRMVAKAEGRRSLVLRDVDDERRAGFMNDFEDLTLAAERRMMKTASERSPGAAGGRLGTTATAVTARTPPPPPPPPRTNRTRRVLHPVLIGHAASLSQASTSDSSLFMFTSPVKMRTEAAAARGEWSGERRFGMSTLGRLKQQPAAAARARARARHLGDSDSD